MPCGSSHVGTVIISHPQSVQASCGETVRLQLEVNQGKGTSLQWYKDGLPLVNEYSSMPTLMIYVVRESDSGLYHCRVTHPQGVLDSRPARVTIVPLRQPIHEFPGPLPYSYSHHGYPLPRDEPSPYSSSSVDLYHEQSSSRRGSCDTASLTSLDSLQIGAHKTYSEAGGTGLSPRGHLSGMPLHIQGMPEDHRSTTLPEGLCVQDMEQCNNISDYQPLVTVRNMNTWSQMYFQY